MQLTNRLLRCPCGTWRTVDDVSLQLFVQPSWTRLFEAEFPSSCASRPEVNQNGGVNGGVQRWKGNDEKGRILQ